MTCSHVEGMWFKDASKSSHGVTMLERGFGAASGGDIIGSSSTGLVWDGSAPERLARCQNRMRVLDAYIEDH